MCQVRVAWKAFGHVAGATVVGATLVAERVARGAPSAPRHPHGAALHCAVPYRIDHGGCCGA